jgi:hypothetical protein
LDVQSGVQGVDVLRAEELACDKVSCGFVIWLDFLGLVWGKIRKNIKKNYREI